MVIGYWLLVIGYWLMVIGATRPFATRLYAITYKIAQKYCRNNRQ